MRRVLALGLLLVGCSSPRGVSTIPPAIDKLDMPATVAVDATGHATLTGSVQFHDDDDNVVAVAIRLVKDGKESTGTLSTPPRPCWSRRPRPCRPVGPR